MPRKQRDYKAEYARQKAKAKAAGYKSEREYKRVRAQLNLPKQTSPIPRRVLAREERERKALEPESKIRRESRLWSKKHSRVKRSEYNVRMSDDEVEKYYQSYVAPLPDGLSRRKKAIAKRKWLHDYLVPAFMTEEEWQQNYRDL